jgi:glycosyltransferase involved in cell wall biosynthesis
VSNKPLCLVTAPVATRSGYGAHSRDICRSLIRLDKYDVKIYPVRWGTTPQNALNEKDTNDIPIIERLLSNPNLDRQPDIHIHIVIPNEFQPLGKYNIGITAGIETTACPPQWIEGMNRMNLNIVPSTFTKSVLEKVQYEKEDNGRKLGNLKLERPIEVLFEGCDTNIYKPTKDFSIELHKDISTITEKVVFLYVGHWLQGGLGKDRKDTGMLIKVFLETFKNKLKAPALLLKSSGATFSIIDREEMLRKIEEIKKTVVGRLPNVYLLHGDLTDEEMNELYNHPKVKAHVSFTKGEGFGRPLLEASLSGKPVIASDWSGHTDFLDKELAVMLPGELVDVDPSAFPDNIYTKGAQWFQVNYGYASKVLKDIFKNYKGFLSKSKKLGEQNYKQFSLDAMTKEFGNILDEYVPEFPKEVKLQLPKLKKVGDSKGLKLPKLKKV